MVGIRFIPFFRFLTERQRREKRLLGLTVDCTVFPQHLDERHRFFYIRVSRVERQSGKPKHGFRTYLDSVYRIGLGSPEAAYLWPFTPPFN